MKILMLGWELPPHNSGGLGVACLYLSKSLAASGVDIDFVIPYTASHPRIKYMHVLSATNLGPFYYSPFGAYTQFIGKTSVNEHVSYSIRDIQKTYCEFIREYLKTHTPEIIHAHDWLTYEAGIIAKKEKNIPLIAHVHATEYDRSGMHRGNPLIHDIEAQGLMLADRIIAVSENTKQLIHEKYHIPLSKIDVLYNALGENFLNHDYHFDEEGYKYLKTLQQSGYTIVSTVGRLTTQKGLCNLMRAAALALQKYPKLLFIFAGDGEQKNELINLASELGISGNVFFTGFIRGKKLRDIYSVSDIFVMSSISEPFGLTALEAAHYGNAIILTKQSGVSEVLYSTLKYDFWDEQKLADEIVAVAQNDTLKHALQQNIQQEYRNFSWDDIAKKCLRIYKRAQHKKSLRDKN